MDLNVIYEHYGEKDENIIDKIKKAFELGFETIAINTVIDSSVLEEKNVKIPEPTDISLSENLTSGGKRLRILRRLTAVIRDGIHGHHLMQHAATKKYDLVAVRPVGEKMLQHVCASLDVDIISIDFSERLPFSLKRTYIGQARERGIVFEIEYSPCLRDQTARRWVISNSQILLDVAKRQNLIVSSGALKILDLRGVFDIINLCRLFGFNDNEAKAAVRTNGQLALSHASTRRKTGAGYVSAQEIFKLARQDKWLVSACRIPNVTTVKSQSKSDVFKKEIPNSPPLKKFKKVS